MTNNITIIKRNNDVVDFNKEKIETAIKKAMKYGSGIYKPEIAKTIASEIESYYKTNQRQATISSVEELVYTKLIDYKQDLTAKAYEGYRAVQSFKRNTNTTDESILSLLDRSNEAVMNENSNKNGVLAATQRDLIAGEVSKDIARRKLIPSHIVQAHDDGALHYHDLDCANCCLETLDLAC